MTYNILIIEDQKDKKDHLINLLYLNHDLGKFDHKWAQSISAAYGHVKATPAPDVIILDMAFASQMSRSQTAANNLAGKEILEYLNVRGINSPVIVATSYHEFGSRNKLQFNSTQELDKYLNNMFQPNYLGLVKFQFNSSNWHTKFFRLIEKALKKNET